MVLDAVFLTTDCTDCFHRLTQIIFHPLSGEHLRFLLILVICGS